MSKKKAGPQKIKDPAEITAVVMEWFDRENKPVTPQALTDALGSRISKPLIQKALEELLAQGRLQGKDLKKVRFFYLNATAEAVAAAATTATTADADAGAEAGPPPDHNDNEEDRQAPPDGDPTPPESCPADPEDEQQQHQQQAVDDEAKKAALIAAIVEATRALAERKQALATYNSIPTAAERADRLRAAAGEVAELQAEVAAAESRAAAGACGAASASTAVDDAVYSYRRARALWKERREFTNRLIEGVLGDTWGRSELSEMFGITTDAEAGVSFAESVVQLPPSLLLATPNNTSNNGRANPGDC